MATLLVDDFTGTTTDPWNASNWTGRTQGGTGSGTIQTNRGRLTAATGAYTAQYALGAPASGDADDFDVTFSWDDQGAGEQYLDFIYRCTTNATSGVPGSAFLVEVSNASNKVGIYSLDSGGAISTGIEVTSAGVNDTATHRMRILVVGTQHRVKWWNDGTAEPSTWQIDETDPDGGGWTTGRVLLGKLNGADGTSKSTDIDDFILDDLTGSSTPEALAALPARAPFSWPLNGTRVTPENTRAGWPRTTATAAAMLALVAPPSTTTGTTGTVAVTNAPDVGAAVGTTIVVGTVAVTNAPDAATASGSAGSGTTGTVAATNAADTSTASGTTVVVGTLSVTNAPDTSSAAGTPKIVGTVSVTNSPDTSTASGRGVVTGTVSVTLAADTSSAAGSPVVVGTIAVTNAPDVATATGSAGSAATGTVAATNAPDTATASGTSIVVGTLSVTNSPDTSSAAGTTTIVGTLSVTNGADVAAGAGSPIVVGTVSVTLAADTASASGTTTITGTVSVTNAPDTATASGTAGNAPEPGIVCLAVTAPSVTLTATAPTVALAVTAPTVTLAVTCAALELVVTCATVALTFSEDC